MSTASAEAKELSLVGKVELRIALTDTDTKLESILNTYLSPLLLKLASEHVSVRNKVISICQHINTRIKAPEIKLPVASLLKQYKENTNALIRHFDVLYIQQGLDRLPVSDRLGLLPVLINGIHRNYEESTRHTSSLFNMLLNLLHSMTLPPRGSPDDIALRQQLGLETSTEDALFISSWIGRLILFASDPSKKTLPALDAEECSFLQLEDKKDTWQPGAAGGMNIVETKVVAVKFLASGAFTDTERFFPALFASSDTNSRLSDVGDDMLKRAIPAISMDDDEIVNQLFRVYLGTRGTNGSLPARASLQTKILGLLCKSKRATSYKAESIQIVREGLTLGAGDGAIPSVRGSKGLEASRLRTQIFAYTNWLAKWSDTADVDVIAPSLVSQLRSYIESQGWPIYHEDVSGTNGNETSLRSLGYESIGVLARASPAKLILDEDLELLRWLFDSLAADSAGREVCLSIENALSSVLGAFGGKLSKEVEQSLEGLLLHNMQRQPGDTADIRVVRSAQFTAVRFANRCLDFNNTKARWMNVMAIGAGANERRELLEEGVKGLDPYWYRVLNPTKMDTVDDQDATSSKYNFPRLVDLIEQFFGKGSIWSVARSLDVALPMSDAYGPAVMFCHNVLLHQGLSADNKAADNEWERQLEVLVSNDGPAREKVKTYLRTMAASHESRSALELLLSADFNGVITLNSKAASCGACVLQLCSLCPNFILSSLAQQVQLLYGSVMATDKSIRQTSSRLFGILASHPDCPQTEVKAMIRDFDKKSGAWSGAVGSQYIQVHGALLANAFYWSRRAYRLPASITTVEETSIKSVVEVNLKILTSSHDKTLLDAAIVSILQLTLSGILSPRLLPSAYSTQDVIKKLGADAEKGSEDAVKALGAFAMQCDEDFAEDSPFGQITSALFRLHSVRDATIQFAVGEALGYAAAGWQSKSLVAALDVECDVPPSPSRDVSLPTILDNVLEECKTTKPALRQASVIWLLCLVQFCGHLPVMQDRLRDCQLAFKGFLADRDSLNQETASRGLSLVYEKGDRELKEDLVRDLVGSFTGSSVNMSGTVSAETQLFEPGVLPTDDGSITTYKDIMSLAAEVGNPSLVYKFMSLAANNAIWSSRAAFGRFGLSNIFSDSSVDGYLAQNPKLYPVLFRYRFDPNTNVRNSMNEIWTALVREPTATIDQHFDSIMGDLLKSILGKEWRTRQACCAAIGDLVQSRPAAKYEKYIGEIWTLTFKVRSFVPWN